MPRSDVDPKLKRIYDEYYTQDISSWRELGAVDKVANIRALCAELNPSTVLDIGAGEGAVLQRLADGGFGKRHHALEISQSGVERIRSRGIPSLVECLPFDGYTIPYADATFDLAILTHVVEHAEHPRLLLSEAARVADHVFVEVPLEHNRGLPANFVANEVGHINFYSAKTIRLLIQSCGYEILRQRETHPAVEQYVYRLGRKGRIAYFLKDWMLLTMPSLALWLWTYHSSLVFRSARSCAGTRLQPRQPATDCACTGQ